MAVLTCTFTCTNQTSRTLLLSYCSLGICPTPSDFYANLNSTVCFGVFCVCVCSYACVIIYLGFRQQTAHASTVNIEGGLFSHLASTAINWHKISCMARHFGMTNIFFLLHLGTQLHTTFA